MRLGSTHGKPVRRACHAWSALLVLTLGLGATVALYVLSGRHEKQNLRSATHVAAEAFRAEISAEVEFDIADLIRLVMPPDRITSADHRWQEHAARYIQRRPGCIAVEFLTPAHRQDAIVFAPADKRRNTPLAFDGIPVDLLKAATESGRPVVSRSTPIEGRQAQRIAAVPIEVQGDVGGFVLAFFTVQDRFDSILADLKDLGFSLRLLEDGREQYRMIGNSGENGAQEYTETANVILPGVTWELRVSPETVTLHAMDAKLPEVTLAVGVLISFLLATTVYFANSATAQSRDLRQINRELTEEVRQREQAEEELRRAHDNLETRVQQRTTELSMANAKLEHEIVDHAHAEQSLQKLTGQLFQLQDEERRRLARELHDGATQNLIALGMNMASLRTQALAPAQKTELLDDCARLIQQSVGDLRTTSHLLHPPLIEELGLPATLRSYVDGFSTRSGIRVALDLDPQLGRLNRDVELGIFRIVQESLANVHRHAHCTAAKILLCREHAHVRLEISDAGTGMRPEVLSRTGNGLAGVGIAGMRERVRLLGGHFEIHSGSGGTTIDILLPVKESQPCDEIEACASG